MWKLQETVAKTNGIHLQILQQSKLSNLRYENKETPSVCQLRMIGIPKKTEVQWELRIPKL